MSLTSGSIRHPIRLGNLSDATRFVDSDQDNPAIRVTSSCPRRPWRPRKWRPWSYWSRGKLIFTASLDRLGQIPCRWMPGQVKYGKSHSKQMSFQHDHHVPDTATSKSRPVLEPSCRLQCGQSLIGLDIACVHIQIGYCRLHENHRPADAFASFHLTEAPAC